ncbi:FkbM family methyltransferase [Variovorax sp. LjRoot290]|uniref:FkbM family methyltransferase n=1 Tax=unclassified Variovorax TaxID=663243 RepID=UPI003ECC41A0
MTPPRLETVNVGYSRIVDAPLSDSTIQVRCWKLDDYFQEVKNIRLVKIDVQGHEAQAIKGMEGILRKCSPVVVFETALQCVQGRQVGGD